MSHESVAIHLSECRRSYSWNSVQGLRARSAPAFLDVPAARRGRVRTRERIDHLGGAPEVHADVRELSLAPLVEAGDRIAGEHDTEVALAGLIDGGARVVGEVAAAEHERAEPPLAQVTLQRGPVEGAPAGLVDRNLVRPQMLDRTGEQPLAVERQPGLGKQLRGELRAGSCLLYTS